MIQPEKGDLSALLGMKWRCFTSQTFTLQQSNIVSASGSDGWRMEGGLRRGWLSLWWHGVLHWCCQSLCGWGRPGFKRSWGTLTLWREIWLDKFAAPVGMLNYICLDEHYCSDRIALTFLQDWVTKVHRVYFQVSQLVIQIHRILFQCQELNMHIYTYWSTYIYIIYIARSGSPCQMWRATCGRCYRFPVQNLEEADLRSFLGKVEEFSGL